MNEMIERVAVAVNNRLRERGAKPIPFHVMYHAAAAAIEAMREPTEAMIKAGQFPTRKIDLGNGTTTTGFGLGASAGSSYRAMIEAALAEDPAPSTYSGRTGE